jgi:hypothetical protein
VAFFITGVSGLLFVSITTNQKLMKENKQNANVNHQDHPHIEGQQNNTPPIHHADDQRRSSNHNQPMSNMLNESEEQKAGRAHGQKDESQVQQDERQP